MTTSNEVHQVKSPKKTLLLMLIVSIIPVLAAYIMFYTGVGVPDNTVNKGKILKPAVHLGNVLSSSDMQYINDNKKWRLLIPVTDNCAEQCQQNLYTTRQVHIRLSEKGSRLERAAVNLAGTSGREFLESIAEEHPYLKTFTVPFEQWQNWIAQSDVNPSSLAGGRHYYLLVDQEGFAMMLYTQTQSGNELLKDIKRALKFSIDYE